MWLRSALRDDFSTVRADFRNRQPANSTSTTNMVVPEAECHAGLPPTLQPAGLVSVGQSARSTAATPARLASQLSMRKSALRSFASGERAGRPGSFQTTARKWYVENRNA